MFGGRAVRERRCPACAVVARGRGARWCGACGAPLSPVRDAGTATGIPTRWRVVLSGVGAATLLAVVAGGGLVDRRATGSTAVQDLAVAPPDPSALQRVDRRAPPEPPSVTAPTCRQERGDGCFLWVAEAAGHGFDTATASDGLILTGNSFGGRLHARDVTDGRVVWSVVLDVGPGGGTLLTAGDLLLHAEAGGLTGRELATGRQRWQTDRLGYVVLHDVHLGDGVLVVAGSDPRASGETDGPPVSVAAGLDPATGELRWREGADDVSLGAGGTAVLVDGTELRAHGPDGTTRWHHEEIVPRDGGAWASGHAVHLYDAHGRSQLHRLRDGEPLGIDGHVIASDEDHSFVELTISDVEGRYVGQGIHALLDADGVVWDTTGSGWSGCTNGVELTETTVDVTTCAGERVVLDLADGTLLRGETPEDRARTAGDRGADGLPYAVDHELNPDGTAGDVVIYDLAEGTELARLPPDSEQVVDGERWWDLDLGGVVAWRSRGWLVALPVPPARPVPPGPPGTDAARSATR